MTTDTQRSAEALENIFSAQRGVKTLVAEIRQSGGQLEKGAMRRLSWMPVTSMLNYLRSILGRASPRQAIKAHCMECVCWQRKEVKLCTAPGCALYPYRPFKKAGEK